MVYSLKEQRRMHMNGYKNGYANGYTNGCTSGCMNGCTNGYKDGCTNGYKDGCTNGVLKRFVSLMLCLMMLFCQAAAEGTETERMLQMVQTDSLPTGEWQKTGAFPDWTGRVDDTLAMNSMMSFRGYEGQGMIYVQIAPGTESFSLYVNGYKCDTAGAGEGLFVVDASKAMVNGINTLQVTNIRPLGLEDAVTVYVPYPVVLDGDLSAEGIHPETLQLISDIIESDIGYGFTSASLAVIRNGRFVTGRSWGFTNSCNPDGTRKDDCVPVTTDTLYDLASVTKVFSVLYAVQKLATDGLIHPEDRIVDILGDEFATETLNITYDGVENPPDYETQVEWKRSLTVRDLLCHQAGFPSVVHYNNPDFDIALQATGRKGANQCYARTRSETLQAIFRTPLYYQPRSRILYSDVEYMLMAFVIEKITGQRLDAYLKDTFFDPLELEHITYLPLQNGFTENDCAATELNGNTRDNLVNFDGIRTGTIQGEVHDERAWYCMEGVSGHAGLFASAVDLAKLATLMLNGGYGNQKFFDRNVMDLFMSPVSRKYGQWGLGWQRQGDDGQMWYYGTMAGSGTVGHQGWTGTLVMIDPERELVIVYLTNKINTPLASKDNPNHFRGSEYTASTLGFVPQILSVGMDQDYDVKEQLVELIADMAADSLKLVPEGAGADNSYVMNVRSKVDVLRKWAGDREEFVKMAEEIEKQLILK